MATRKRAALFLNILWTVFTIVSLGVITAMIFTEPAFALGLGWIRTRGLAGLWVTVPSILLGVAGLILLKTHQTAGFRLLLLYSSFWTATLLPAMLAELPTIVRHPLTYCASGTCMPWVITLLITAAFALSAFWYARQAYSQLRRS